MALRHDPIDMIGVEPEADGTFAVTLWSIDGDPVLLRRHNTAESANDHCIEVRTILATWVKG